MRTQDDKNSGLKNRFYIIKEGFMPYNLEYYKEEKPVRLSEENHDFLVSHISAKWEAWDGVRSSNLHAISAVEKAIYPTYKPIGAKMNINLPEIYEIRETYKAHLWKSWFSSLDSMFDVQGKAKNDHTNAAKQKASLIDIFRSTDLVCKLEKGLDNWINKGEFIAFISWSTKIKQVRRKNKRVSGQSCFNGDEAVFENGYSIFNELRQPGEGAENEFGKLENYRASSRNDRGFSLKDEII